MAVLALAWFAPVPALPAPVDADPLSIDELGTLVRGPTSLQRVADIDGGEGFSAYLVAYRQAGLLLHALVAVPQAAPPERGYPVLVAAHGFHPDPPRYGITPEGRDWRPGNYYRPVPAAYAAAGFLVVMPDYRGHNRSQGREYTRRAWAHWYYAEDVAALLGGLTSIARADTQNLFLWGHSMGGEVALITLLAAEQRVRGASLWSTAAGPIWERAFLAARKADPLAFDSDQVTKPALDLLEQELAALGPNPDAALLTPASQLARLRAPVIIHHAIGDQSTDPLGSARLAAELRRLRKPYAFHSYPGTNHFFVGAEFDTAVARDVAFFRSLMASKP